MIEGPRRQPQPHRVDQDADARPARPSEPSRAFRSLSGAPTPLDSGQASLHLGRAWQAVLGEPVPGPALDLLWAQWALETGRGRSMRGNNFGGIKARRGGALLPTTEGSGAERVRVLCRFRTYATPDEGARDHVKVIAQRFPLALEALRRGDGRAFVAELARAGYFTADPDAYRSGIERLASEHAGRPAEPVQHAVPVMDLVEGVLASLRPRASKP